LIIRYRSSLYSVAVSSTEGLRHVVVAAERQPADAILGPVASRQEQDRDALALVAEPPGDVEPVPVREHHVQDDQVGTERRDGVHRLAPGVGHVDVEAFVPERRRQEVGDVLLVVDHEDPGRVLRRCVHRSPPGRSFQATATL
jgi:hypothetical protein